LLGFLVWGFSRVSFVRVSCLGFVLGFSRVSCLGFVLGFSRVSCLGFVLGFFLGFLLLGFLV
jgi:hypothetical protein